MLAVAAAKKLNTYLEQIEGCLPHRMMKDESVSKVDIGWQLDHSLNVLIKIIDAIQQSNEAEYQASNKFWWVLLSSLHWMPRGKGRSPKTVLPDSTITEASLQAKLEETRVAVRSLEDLAQNAFFKHPVFGNLNKAKAIRFMNMHTQHHLKIVRDIKKRQRA